MPLVNGIQSTQMIRDLERTLPPANPTHRLPLNIEEVGSHLTLDPISPPQTDPGAGHSLASRDYFQLPLSPPISDTTSRQSSLAPLSTSPSVTRGTQRPRKSDRVPIFAVSASLDQHTQESLAGAGFDGWLSKPIDFKRLYVILQGVMSPESRVQRISATGDFARGGWFN
jgi:hypothetical protein